MIGHFLKDVVHVLNSLKDNEHSFAYGQISDEIDVNNKSTKIVGTYAIKAKLGLDDLIDEYKEK
jgi:hypothetical protein